MSVNVFIPEAGERIHEITGVDTTLSDRIDVNVRPIAPASEAR